MSHIRYIAQLGARGRLVLPAPLRRALGLEQGTPLVLELDGDEIRVARARDVARSARGLLRDDSGRNLVGELLAERREEAARETQTASDR
jgi:AbrB family looped-hinge helix DNA binding protein